MTPSLRASRRLAPPRTWLGVWLEHLRVDDERSVDHMLADGARRPVKRAQVVLPEEERQRRQRQRRPELQPRPPPVGPGKGKDRQKVRFASQPGDADDCGRGEEAATLGGRDGEGDEQHARAVEQREADRREEAVREQARDPQGQSSRRVGPEPPRHERRQPEPEEDVLQRVGLQNPLRPPEPERPRGPAEEDAPGAIGRQIEGAVDRGIAQQRLERELRVVLPIVAGPRRMSVVRDRLQHRQLARSIAGEADHLGEAVGRMVQSRDGCQEQHHERDGNGQADPLTAGTAGRHSRVCSLVTPVSIPIILLILVDASRLVRSASALARWPFQGPRR